MPVAHVVGIALQLVQGLEELHSNNILHLSLKPSNVLMESSNHDVVLSDFGVSQDLQRLPDLTTATLTTSVQYL